MYSYLAETIILPAFIQAYLTTVIFAGVSVVPGKLKI